METNESFRNPFILYSIEYCNERCKSENITRSKANKDAATEWNDVLTVEQKNRWYRLFNEKKLLEKIEKNRDLLISSNVDLMKSTYNSPFIIEHQTLMAGLEMEKRALKSGIPENNNDEYIIEQ